MRACVKPANGKVEIVDIPTPEPGPGEMIVKTSMATVCGSDMHFLDEFPNEMLGALFVGSVLPEGLLMGHEGVGTVHAVGDGVSRFREGDRVMASCLVGCGKCRECMTVDHSVCTGGGRVLFGCQAEYYKVPFADVNAAKVPDGVSDEMAILATDILSTGFGAIERGEAWFGASVAIFAQGPVGLCATAGARARGCGLIIAVDALPGRLEMSKRLGANVVINPKEEDPVAKILSLTGGSGVDVAVEAVGTQATFEACTKAVRRGGVVSSVGVYVEPSMGFPAREAFFKDLTLKMGICNARNYMAPLLPLVQRKKLQPARIVTHTLPLKDAPRGYAIFDAKQDRAIKVMLKP